LTLLREDPYLLVNPVELGFAPAGPWADEKIHFTQIVTDFFQARHTASRRFPYKLFNALVLGESDPTYKELTGVAWATDSILRVDKIVFANLLGLHSIDGSIFHQQGNYPTHGFFEIGSAERAQHCPSDMDMTGVDFDNVRLLIHRKKLFKTGCTRQEIEGCKWSPSEGTLH
jgi:hypothetical protein